MARRARANSPSALELHIEELVLDGFAAADRYAVAEALEQELGRLLADQGVPEAWRAGRGMERLAGGAFSASLVRGSRQIGAQVARAVYSSRTLAR